MSQGSDYEYDSDDELWRSVPGCIGTVYNPNPIFKDWIAISTSDSPALKRLQNRLTVDKPPKKPRKLRMGKDGKKYRVHIYNDESMEPQLDISAESEKEPPPTTPTTPSPGINKPVPAALKSRRNLPWKRNLQPVSPSSSSKRDSTSDKPRRDLPASFHEKFKCNTYKPPAQAEDPRLSASKQYENLSPEQKEVHDFVVNEKKNVFFSGSAGTGKSVLLRAIISTLKGQYNFDEVAVTASTGIAAVNIEGQTIHSFAHIQFGDKPADDYLKKILKTPRYERALNRVKFLIVEEISMIDGRLLDKIDWILRKVRKKSNVPFGGIQVVLCGDFYQLPPVNRGSTSMLAFEANCWRSLTERIFILKTPFRQKDPYFVKMLNEIRIGSVSMETEHKILFLSRTPIQNDEIAPTELYPRRAQVDAANVGKLSSLGGEEHKFISIDRGHKELLENCMAPRLLCLKVGAQVMLIKNLTSTLVNGSIGIVAGFTRKNSAGILLPVVKFANGEERTLAREDWDLDIKGVQSAGRSQIPLILAWALSIHKSQGQTIQFVKVDLRQVFEDGQAYVALSRATCLENLQVLNFKKSLVKAHPKVTDFYNKIQ